VKPPAFKFNSGTQKIVDKDETAVNKIDEDNDSTLLKAE